MIREITNKNFDREPEPDYDKYDCEIIDTVHENKVGG